MMTMIATYLWNLWASPLSGWLARVAEKVCSALPRSLRPFRESQSLWPVGCKGWYPPSSTNLYHPHLCAASQWEQGHIEGYSEGKKSKSHRLDNNPAALSGKVEGVEVDWVFGRRHFPLEGSWRQAATWKADRRCPIAGCAQLLTGGGGMHFHKLCFA